LAHNLEPWRPGREGVALRLDLPGIGDKPVDFAAERDEPRPELGVAVAFRRSARPQQSRGRLARQLLRQQTARRFDTQEPPGWPSIHASRSRINPGKTRMWSDFAPVRGGAMRSGLFAADVGGDFNTSI
jgi:hypothetical protein